MCGILGSYSKKFHFKQEQINIICHRGPDDKGYFFENNVMLGHSRLSIIDITSNGHQPMLTNDNRYVIVFNGEIYNHYEIRNELENLGFKFKSKSDTETILNGYVKWGVQILNKLSGIFAFAIYDKLNGKLFIARDHFGVKPLYFYNQDGIFAFSSELKALTQIDGFDQSISIESLFYYLQTLYAPGSMTPFNAVNKLLPGHYLILDTSNGKLEDNTYYNLKFSESKEIKSEEEWINELDLILNKAVERQLMSDVPIGFFLSGGLDSSLLVAIAKNKISQNSIKCFTISTGKKMHNEGFSDDEFYAKKVAKYLNVDLEVLPAQVFSKKMFDKMIWHLDEPQADPAPINVYNICKGARKFGIKVLISGSGGDDLFSGYRRHQVLVLEKYFKLIPDFIKIFFSYLIHKVHSKSSFFRRLKKVLRYLSGTKLERFAGYFMWIEDKYVFDLFEKTSQLKLKKNNLPMSYWQNLLNKLPSNTSDLNKMLFLELSTFLPDHNLNYTDKMSMAVGVETRVPYLDYELVEFANRLPIKYKMNGKTTKYLLRKVAEKYLPMDVIYRPKTGFGAPIRSWIRKDLKNQLDLFPKDSILIKMGILNSKAVKKLIENDYTGKIDAAYTILGLLAIESWYKQFLNIEKINSH
jgi:asparagine synthase (glutamine-hydrolysing)